MTTHSAADPRLVATSATLTRPGELTTNAPGPLDRAMRAASVTRKWLTRDALGTLTQLFDTDIECLRRERVTEVDGADWLHPEQSLPAWALAGPVSLPGGLEWALRLLRETVPVERFAARHFNFRGANRERSQASRGDFTAAQSAAVRRCADELQLRQPTRPHYARYDSTLVLGGGWRSPVLRARYAALLQGDGVDLGQLYFLGSPRPLLTDNPPERSITDEYAPGAEDEFDLMTAAASHVFRFAAGPSRLICGCPSTLISCPRWPLARSAPPDTAPQLTHERSRDVYAPDGTVRGVVLSASTSRPPQRPDTTDTLKMWARRIAAPPGSRTLVVTTPQFVPFQTFDSLKELYLDGGVDVDVVGYSYDWPDRPDIPEALLQETLSGIRSARRLLVAGIAPFVG